MAYRNLCHGWTKSSVDKIVRENYPPQKPRLLDQVRNAIRIKHYSIRTEQSYIDWIKRYIFFHNKRHPKEMGEREISDFLTFLAVKKKSFQLDSESGPLCIGFSLYSKGSSADKGS